MAELFLEIMDVMEVDSISFCLNDVMPLLVSSMMKVEKGQVRKVVQDIWKLTPASNSLTYTTYELNFNQSCHYRPVTRVGRYYTIKREKLLEV